MKKAVYPVWEDLMIKNRLNFKKLSEKVPILSPQAWRRRFVGESQLTIVELVALARFFNTTAKELLTNARIEGEINE